MSFFVTSVGSADRADDAYVGGNFGGAEGADAFCSELATAAGAGSRSWRAYVSTYDPEDFSPVEVARARIGAGPWHNAAGQLIAADPDALHASGIPADRTLDEYGTPVPSDAHDIFTGTDSQGGLASFSSNCLNYTSSLADGANYGFVGHADGGGVGQETGVSWNAAHFVPCDEAGMAAQLGHGRLYCFSPGPAGTVSPTPAWTLTPTPSAGPGTLTPTPSVGPGTLTPTRTAPVAGEDVELEVRETAGLSRSGEVLRSGIPIPRSMGLLGTEGLAVVDGAGVAVPAEFEVLARWNAGLAEDAPIQWLLITFAATVEAGGSRRYRLVTDGSAGPNPTPSLALSLTRQGDQVTVDTGAARFVLGGAAGALFDEVGLEAGAALAQGGSMTGRAAGAELTHPTRRGVTVEHAGPLMAIVVVEGAYDLPPVGGGGLGTRRRYEFRAGSPVAIVRQSVQWEGSRCGLEVLSCDGAPNGVLVERLRDTLIPPGGGPRSVLAVGAFGSPAVEGTAQAGQSAFVRQKLRSSRTQELLFDVSVPGGAQASGSRADGGMLMLGGASGGLAVALRSMHRYEPQALRLLPDGELAVDLVDDRAWLGNHQGLFATMAVAALPPSAARQELDGLIWAPLNRPLRAWPSAAWWNGSGAVEGVPAGGLPSDLASYDTVVPGILDETLRLIDEKGLPGLMSFGLYPRYWGTILLGDELDCGEGADPTPGDDWDDLYWCASWTDYHNASATAPIWAMRSGQVQRLDELGFPAALRMLHTQIVQCAPGDPYFRCGSASTGYAGYRSDFNSSHQYWDNLFLYYWLTGDRTVLQTIRPGAEAMRGYLCSRRPAAACQPDDPPTDEFAGLAGRVASQWFAAFRFLGLASEDASFLDDYRSGLARALTQFYAEPRQAGIGYGLLFDLPIQPDAENTTAQAWMASLYDLKNLHRLMLDTNDAPLGNPAIRPSQALAAWSRTLRDHFATAAPGGDGTMGGAWANQLSVRFEPPRLGGSLQSAVYTVATSDPLLYDTGKSCLPAVLAQAGELGLSRAAAVLTLDVAPSYGPLGKAQGLLLSRLHPAIALLAPPPGAVPALGAWVALLLALPALFLLFPRFSAAATGSPGSRSARGFP